MEIPPLVVQAAKLILLEGYSRSEAYPIARWRALGLSEQKEFFEVVDACIKLLIAMKKL